MRMGGITHTKIEAISLKRVCEVILASTETSVKLTVPFEEETCYTRLQVEDFSVAAPHFYASHRTERRRCSRYVHYCLCRVISQPGWRKRYIMVRMH